MKDFNIAKYLKEHNLGPHGILGKYVDLHSLKEVEDLEGLEVVEASKNSETITLYYYDYPSISDSHQRYAVETFIKFVESLKGKAEVKKDKFEEIQFKLTGISAEQVKKDYNKLLKKLNKRSVFNPHPFDELASWTVNDEFDQIEEEEVGNNKPVDEVPYKGAETKLDGFGDEFNQVDPVEEEKK